MIIERTSEFPEYFQKQLNELNLKYAGHCKICKNQYEDWKGTKEDVLVKIKSDMRRMKVIYKGNTYWIQEGAGGNTPMKDRLEFVLKQNGIIA